MRLVTFTHAGRTALGALMAAEGGERVVDLHDLDGRIPADILGFLEAGSRAQDLAQHALAGVTADRGVPLAQVTLKAPIPKPGKIICIGQNYRGHVRETNAPMPEFPVIFAKYGNAVIGPGEPIVLPAAVERPDYEGELGVVIGRRGRSIPEAQALEYVAGYVVINDVTARDWQFRTSQWTLGKTPDTFCPMGPALVTADEIPDVQNLSLSTIVSGEVMQQGHTSDMIFSVAHLIWDMARIMTLEPGDVIATGTPSGVGFTRTPPRLLHAGDVVRIEIERVGVLENPVVAEQ